MFYRSKRRNDLDITKSRLAVIWFKTNEQQNSNFLRIIIFLSFAENSGRLPRVRLQQPQEQRYPFLTVCAVFSCVQTKIWLLVLGIFNVRTDVNACDCTRGLCGHRKRVCTESRLWEKNPIAAPRNRTCLSGVPVPHSTN